MLLNIGKNKTEDAVKLQSTVIIFNLRSVVVLICFTDVNISSIVEETFLWDIPSLIVYAVKYVVKYVLKYLKVIFLILSRKKSNFFYSMVYNTGAT